MKYLHEKLVRILPKKNRRGEKKQLARLFNSRCHHSSTVTGTIPQQSLACLFNSHWHDYSTVTGTIVQQSLARLINSGWHDSSTVTGIILQQSLAGLFNSHGQIFTVLANSASLLGVLITVLLDEFLKDHAFWCLRYHPWDLDRDLPQNNAVQSQRPSKFL